MAYAIDPIYGDPNVEYANEDPIGGTGMELAGNRPGFIYMDPRAGAAGEAAARSEFNSIPGPVEPPDMTGNAIAAQRNLEWDTRHAIAQAQRDIEDSYYHAKSIGEMNAARAAEEHLRQRSMADAIASGMPLDQAWLQYGGSGYAGGRGGSTLNALHASEAPNRMQLENGQEALWKGNTVKILPKPKDLSEWDNRQLEQARKDKQAAQLAQASLAGQAYPEQYQAIIDEKQAIIDRLDPQAATPYAPRPSPPVQSNENRVSTKQQFNALKSGDVYIGKDGKKYRKP